MSRSPGFASACVPWMFAVFLAGALALAGAAMGLAPRGIRLKPDSTGAGVNATGAGVNAEMLAAFAPTPQDPDAAVFAAARKRFLFPESVTYCNTGTLGASPREVVDAMNRGVERLEQDLPDWPYFQADGEPLTGYQMLRDALQSVRGG